LYKFRLKKKHVNLQKRSTRGGHSLTCWCPWDCCLPVRGGRSEKESRRRPLVFAAPDLGPLVARTPRPAPPPPHPAGAGSLRDSRRMPRRADGPSPSPALERFCHPAPAASLRRTSRVTPPARVRITAARPPAKRGGWGVKTQNPMDLVDGWARFTHGLGLEWANWAARFRPSAKAHSWALRLRGYWTPILRPALFISSALSCLFFLFLFVFSKIKYDRVLFVFLLLFVYLYTVRFRFYNNYYLSPVN